MRRSIRHGRRTRQVLGPMFPNYLFVQINSDWARYRPILSTLGVRTLVRVGDRPALLSDDFIQTLKAREIDGAIVRPPTPYQPGQEVRITGGAFNGLIATILETDEKNRLTVLMNFFNRPITTKFTADMVFPA